MGVASGRRQWLALLAVVSVVLFGDVFASAQASDPVFRFFGFKGDVTIDGEPLAPGTEIVAIVNDEEVGRATVNQSGAWILDVSRSDLDEASCGVTFVVDGLSAPEKWDCSNLRLRLALFSDGEQRDSAELIDEQAGEGEQDATKSGEEGDANDATGAASDAELTSSDDDSDETAQQEQGIVRPAAPRTGTGGVLDADESTNWPRAAAITALVTLGVAVVALLMGWRSDGAA
jgi:hypothetical protein